MKNSLTTVVTLALIFGVFSAFSQGKSDKKQILEVLGNQQKAWNSGNLEQFMVGYLENDSLMFVGSSGIVYGYNNTLKRYQTTYNSSDKMGQLNFTVDVLRQVSKDVYFMVGKYHLTRTIGDANGIFTLVWKKEKGKWVIFADHSE